MLQGGAPPNGARNSASGDRSDEKVGIEWWDGRLPPPRPDPVSFGIVIDGCAIERNAVEAIRLLNRMRAEGIGDTLGDFQESNSGTRRQKKAAVRLRRREEEEEEEKEGNSVRVGGEHDEEKPSCENSGRAHRVTTEESLGSRPGAPDERNREGEGSVIAGGVVRVVGGENHERHHVRGRTGHLDVQDSGPPRPNAYCVTAAISACGRAGMPHKGVEILLDALEAEAAWSTRRHDAGQLAPKMNVSATFSGVRVDDQGASAVAGGGVHKGQGGCGLGGRVEVAVLVVVVVGEHLR